MVDAWRRYAFRDHVERQLERRGVRKWGTIALALTQLMSHYSIVAEIRGSHVTTKCH